MAITITIDNDTGTAGIQTLVDDESAGLQTPLTADTGNDSNLDITDATVGNPDSNLFDGTLSGASYSASFLSFLNAATIFGSGTLRITDAQKAFAANVEGAVSSSSFVTVTASAGEAINDLFFSDSFGNALNGQPVAGMQTTLDGSNVYLYSMGDYAIATTSSTPGAGRVVAAFYLNEAANHLSAQVQMITFEALKHPLNPNPDDPLNFTDVLQVSAQGTTSFNFDNLPSGSFLYAAVGSSSAALLVTGQDLNVLQSGPKIGGMVTGGSDPSDTVNTSQGGIGATIGINSQHFTDASGSGGTKVDGAVGVFTLVKGFGSFDATVNGTSEGTGGNVNEITYSDYVDAPSAKIFISQSTGGSGIGGGIRVSLWEAGGGSSADHLPSQLKPEEGLTDTANSYSYIGDTATDSHLRDDTPVVAGTITVKRGATTYSWTSANSGTTQGGITVTIDAAHPNTFTVTGIATSDTIGFVAANDPANPLDGTFNRFDVQALANSNPVDIGRIDLDQGVSISHGVGSDLIVQDDGPTVAPTLNANATVSVDESAPSTVPALDTGAIVKGVDPDNPDPVGGNALGAGNSGSAVVDPHAAFGTDGPAATGSLTYALTILGVSSGLKLTDGTAINLQQVASGNIVGVVASGTFAGKAAFAIAINSTTGVVTVEQYLSLQHSTADTNGDSDEAAQATLNTIGVTVTAVDGDGDPKTSSAVDISHQISFHDDGPAVAPTVNANATVSVDESGPTAVAALDTGAIVKGDDPDIAGTNALNAGNSGSAVVDPHAVFGADGPATSGSLTYALLLGNVSSGLKLTDGTTITLQQLANGNIVGVVDSGTFSGKAAFAIAIDSTTGVVTVEQYLSLQHNSADTNGDSNEAVQADLNTIGVTVTATDGDSDTITSSAVDISHQISFHDDGPAVTTTSAGAPSLTVDESNFVPNDTKDFSGQFTPSYGADGPAATPVTYAISTPGGDSGLKESGTGNHVFLFNESGVVVGRAGTTILTAATGDIVFTVGVDATGKVTLDQKLAVVHDPNTGVDQSTTLSLANLVTLTATAHDGDGDAYTSPALNMGTLLTFKDDAPTITSQILGGTVEFATDATGTVTHSLNGAAGADGTSSTQTSLSGVAEYAITYWDTPTSVYPNLNAVLSANGTVLTYYSDVADTNAVYQLTLNATANSGAGSYTFAVLQPPPITQTNFGFTDLPSGQNLFGIIATDKSDLSKGGLLVFPSNPVLAADGTYTNASGTINTSKGGGPVTIGNGNQAFDNPGEGAYFMFVDNPTAAGVGGIGLTATSADDADTIRFNGVNQASDASVTIVQASGQGTVSKPGPALHIFAFEANPGNVNSDTLARAEVNNPTLAAANQGTAAPEVDIVGVKIHDSTGKVIEYRTGNQGAGAANLGTLHDVTGDGQVTAADDSLVGIQFVLDNPGGAGTADDIYSVVISNLKAGYTIEYVTGSNHDLALVQNVSGSYDIGGFSASNNQNVPAQDLHFAVTVTDYDNDAYGGHLATFADFAVHIDGVNFV